MDGGGFLGGVFLPLTTKLLATNEWFREEQKPLPSVMYPLDTSPGSDGSNPTVTQMAMTKLNGLQSQAKSQESQKGTGREEQKVNEGKEIEKGLGKE